MNKICTSIEQSEKFIELGIDVNTADMYYPNRVSIDNLYYPKRVGKDNYVLPIVWKNGHPLLSQEIPAWSLSALLGLMPFHIIENNVRYEFQMVKGLNKEGGTYKIKYKSYTSLFETLMYNNPIDACVEMILKLHELNLL